MGDNLMAKGFRNYIDNTMQRIISSEGITHSVYATVMEGSVKNLV